MNDQGTTSGATTTGGGSTIDRTAEGASNPQGTAASSTASAGRVIGRRNSDRIVAASESAQRSLDQATECARGNSAVVIVGPSGSGRQHFGRAIHAWSSRAGEPFVVFPASSTPIGLHERELFGNADGTATLSDNVEGALVSAAGGTLLIAGFDKLDASVRASLIQAVQTQSFVRPGRSEAIRVSARIIATADVSDTTGTLLGALPAEIVSLEALSERREDVLPLAAHFLAEVAEGEEIRPIGFTSDARNWLIEETWVGNVRELRERIRQSVRLSSDGVISAESLMLATDGDEVPSFKDAKRAFETRYVEGLLRRCSGNISRAARLAKKDRKDFYDVIRRTGVNPSEFRT
jgi:two-component system response regulator GlrR